MSSTTDITLRDVIKEDIAIFFAHHLDPEATWMAAFPRKDWDSFAAHWARILRDETIAKQTVLLDGQVAGNIVSFNQLGQPEVGYWIGKQHWGKGVATTALTTFLNQVPDRPLYAHVAKHNPGSRRVLEKCGFTICGEGSVDVDGQGEQVEEWILKLEADRSAATR